jgi:hypothetical protein
VRRYLEYSFDYKKEFKLEEDQVLDMLSENLKCELMVHLNGTMLHDTPVFQKFNILFLSELTFVLQKETYSNNDYIL